jgi:hypothetical protein
MVKSFSNRSSVAKKFKCLYRAILSPSLSTMYTINNIRDLLYVLYKIEKTVPHILFNFIHDTSAYNVCLKGIIGI